MKPIIAFLSSFIISSFFTTVFGQPANDNACGAITLIVENLGCEPTTIYSYTGATWSSGSGNTFCNSYQNFDVWYKFTVPANGEVQVTFAPTTTDFNMSAEFYSSTSCTGLTILNQNTNGFPCMYASSNSGGDGFFKNLVPGSTIYVRVYKLYFQDAVGSFKMCISNTNQLADEPCTAGFFPIESADPLGQPCVAAKPFAWTGATLTPAVPNPSCGIINAADVRDVWFKVRVPASGKISLNFNTIGGSTTFIAMYTAPSCNGPFSEIYCGFYGGQFTTLVPNSVIYCRVYVYSGGPVNSGSANICVAAFNSVPGINDSQKVGIGIDTPFAKLDVVGTGIIRGKLTVGADIETRGNLIVQGNIIGKYGTAVLQGNTTIQGGPLKIDSLDLGSRLGNRVALYGGLGNSPKYGLGIQSSLLQMFSDMPNTNIAFGHGNSYNFTERARIINQGEYGMRLKGRLQLETGTNSAGIWLNNAANTVSPAFIGMVADNMVGFFGSGAGWGLTMNTTTGNVGIGLNTGGAARPLSFPATLGEKILLYPGIAGEVGIGVYGNELRLHADNPEGKVSFGTQTNAGVYSENALAQRNGAYAFSVLGSLWVNGTTYASDQRFKQNILPLNSSLDKLLQLQGVSYNMNTEAYKQNHFNSGKDIGLIAQDVQKIIPEVVGEKDGYLGIDYAKLVPLLIEAIKEQNKKIEKQQQEIETLKKQVGIK